MSGLAIQGGGASQATIAPPATYLNPKSDAEAQIIGSVAHAWRQIAPASAPLQAVEWITTERKRRKRRPVLRLAISGVEHAIVAKRQPSADAAREACVYRDVLPRLGLDAVQVYGVQSDTAVAGQAWLFMAETGHPYQLGKVEHGRAAADFLAQLHLYSAGRNDESLPALGADHHRGVLLNARKSLVERLEAPDAAPLAAVGARLLRSADAALARWDQVAATCADLPAVLVHGSLRGPNLRVVAGRPVRMQAIDWASAGWGPPGRDIQKLPSASVGGRLDDYWRSVRGRGLYRDRQQMNIARILGEGFRHVEHLGWDMDALRWCSAESMAPSLERRVRALTDFEAQLATAGQGAA